jgi:hypothetical protein
MNQPNSSVFERESITEQIIWIMSQLSQQEFKWLICNVADIIRREYYNNNFIVDEIPAYIEVLINKRNDPEEDNVRHVICKKLGLT